jgi:hypothetical protein
MATLLLFEVYSSKQTLIEGYLDILHENLEQDDYFTLRINSTIGDALICHTVDVAFEGRVPEGFAEELPEGESTLSFLVQVVDGQLVYA